MNFFKGNISKFYLKCSKSSHTHPPSPTTNNLKILHPCYTYKHNRVSFMS